MEGAGKPAAGVVALGRLGTKVLKAWREGRILKAIGWRLLRLVPLYRVLLLRRVTFIGITGSCGKTTAKELAAAVLATQFKGRANPASYNAPPHLDRTILRVRPWDAFCLLELSPTKMGKLVFDHVLRMVRPQIGVMTVIGTDHIRTYRTIEAIAAEKNRQAMQLRDQGKIEAARQAFRDNATYMSSNGEKLGSARLKKQAAKPAAAAATVDKPDWDATRKSVAEDAYATENQRSY